MPNSRHGHRNMAGLTVSGSREPAATALGSPATYDAAGIGWLSRFRGDRRSRRSNGKSDAIDAEAAARSVLAETSTAIPKTADGLAGMIRQVKIARDTARKGRTSAIITLKTLIVNTPTKLRESLDGLTNRALINRCARFRVSTMNSPTASAKHSLKALARRWRHLDTEVRSHDAVLDDLTAQASPTLRDAYGIGTDLGSRVPRRARGT